MGRITFEMLEKAYEQTLWLRSHIIGIMYDMIDFGTATKRTVGEVSISQSPRLIIIRLFA